MTTTSVGYAGPITTVGFGSSITDWGTSEYGVRGAGDWNVTPHPSQPGALNVAPGVGWGHGVTDTTTDPLTVQCVLPASGTRWDLIVMHRDWTVPGGKTEPVAIQGTSAAQLPPRDTSPGQRDDQPLFLMQWTAGQTMPTSSFDLRLWAANGGLVAKSELALTYLTRVGSMVRIRDDVWQCTLGANDTVAWNRRLVGNAPFGHMGRTDRFQPINGADVSVVCQSAQELRGGMAFEQAFGGRLVVPFSGRYDVRFRSYITGPPTAYQSGPYLNGIRIEGLTHRSEKLNGQLDVVTFSSMEMPLKAGDKIGIGYSMNSYTWGSDGYNGTWVELRYVGS